MRTIPAVLTAGVLTALTTASGAAQAPAAADEHVRALTCAPSSPLARPLAAIRVSGEPGGLRTLFGPGERVAIAAGADQGIRAGDEYVVRRVIDDRDGSRSAGARALNVHTTGVLRIAEVSAQTAIAVVTLACDGIVAGDYLERLTTLAPPPPVAGGAPDFSAPAQIILGAERRQMAGPREFVIVDRGSDQGIRPGQQMTVFRRAPSAPAGPVAAVGVATVYAVQPASATIRIESSVDAVYVGDLVAIHR